MYLSYLRTSYTFTYFVKAEIVGIIRKSANNIAPDMFSYKF